MINWTNFFIKRPVFTYSIHISLIVFGIIAFSQLEIRLYPKLESSTIQITMDYPGASVSTMRNSVTAQIYDHLGSLDSLDYITANNIQGEAIINLHLKIGSSPQGALNQIIPSMISLRASLPEGVHDPIISIVDSNENPDYLLAFTSHGRNLIELSSYLNKIIKPYFSVVPGVSSVHILGAKTAINISLSPDLLRAYGLESNDIIKALESQNRLSIEGAIQGLDTEFKIKLKSNLSSPKALKGLILAHQREALVRLSDVSTIEWGPETNKIQSFYNGKPSVLVSMKTAPHANILEVLKSLNHKLNKIQNHLPSGVSVHELVNGRHYLVSVIFEMIKTLVISLFIMIVISLCFFNDIRSGFIITLAIPVSFLGAGVILWFLGASINVLTLLAMILVMGLLVDDAIVLIENIFRYREMGFTIIGASYSATKEISNPLIAITLVLGALFLPIGFMGGVTGKLFWEFSLMLVCSVSISAFVALTLLPVLSSQLLKSELRRGSLIERRGILIKKVKGKYFEILNYLIDRKKTVIFIYGVLSLFSIFAYIKEPSNFSPKEDTRLLEVIAQAPESTNTHFLQADAHALSKIYQEITDIHSYSLLVGVPTSHQILSFVRLRSSEESKHSSKEIQHLLQVKINQNLTNAVALIPSLMPGTQGMPIEFVIKSQKSYRELYEQSDKIMKEARKSGIFQFLGRDLQYDEPTLDLQIDRSTSGLLGVPVESIENAIISFLDENTFQYVSHKGELYPVILRSKLNLMKNPNFLSEIFVKGGKEGLVPLSNLVQLSQSVSPEQENQFQKLNSITISAVLKPGHFLSQGIHFFKQQAKLVLPESFSFDFSGNARLFISEGNHMSWLFLIALFTVFIFLSILFESFLDSLIILLGSLPVGILGAMLPFELGLSTMNVYSEIGLLVLSGLICKQGILITYFANASKGACDQRAAIFEAISIRFRPIIMTTVAMLLGVLPLILAGGAGCEARFSLGLVIFSGILFGSFFSLFILPILYLFLHQEKQEV